MSISIMRRTWFQSIDPTGKAEHDYFPDNLDLLYVAFSYLRICEKKKFKKLFILRKVT